MDLIFAEILLPLPLEGLFTYQVPVELKEKVSFGVRVVVSFGKNKLYSGIVVAVHGNVPPQLVLKPVLDVIDTAPIITKKQYELWKWIARYYMCTIGEVMAVALPAGLKLAGETQVLTHPNFDGDISGLTEQELKAVEVISEKHQLSLKDLSKETGLRRVFPVVKSLIEKEILILAEEIKDHFKPKKEIYISLHPDYIKDDKKLYELLETLESSARTQKQSKVLLAFITLSASKNKEKQAHLKRDLIEKANVSPSSLQTLIKNNVLIEEQRSVSRLANFQSEFSVDDIQLSDLQQEKCTQIQEQWKENPIVLFQGVTGSGKTEIYIKLIDKVLKTGKQVLYLLPEIALTSQIVKRLQKYFGEQVGVYHSRFNEFERVEIWNKVLQHSETGEEKYSLVLGARSSLLLPFQNLGLIIVDEEHDQSYKQQDPAPRYQARDVSIVAAKQHECQVLLGTATPSLESYYNVQQKKYAYVELKERFSKSTLPHIWIENMIEAQKQGKVFDYFSQFLIDHIAQALERKEQVILFQNRRGYAVRLHCNVCGEIPTCQHCDVTLTYHKRLELLKCHYCGYAIEVPKVCPKCSSPDISMRGFGTEKLEETLAEFFPKAVIARLDADTTRAKTAYQKIISSFEAQETDILVGTQMVTKGLDFDRVSVVGILDADSLLSFPNFRAFERAFQIMAQVSGRAGRKNVPGNVIIQTYQPYNKAIQYVMGNQYEEMYKDQIAERLNFKYPPIYRMIQITLKDTNAKKLDEAAQLLADYLRSYFKDFVLGPEYPLVGRVQSYFIKDIWVKLHKNNQLDACKDQIAALIAQFKAQIQYKSVRVNINVDC